MTDPATYFAEHGYPRSSARKFAVDFDGTLFPKVGVYAFPDPLPGAAEGLRRLKQAGYHITIFTSRLWPEWLKEAKYTESDMLDYIEGCLKQNDMPFDRIVAKPPASAYVDDLGIRFDGDWPAIVDWLLWSRADD